MAKVHLQSAYPLSDRESVRILFLKLTIQTSTNDWLELLESGIQAAAVFVCFCGFFLTLPKHLTLCPTKLRLEN